MSTRRTGTFYEDRAERYLHGQGLRTILKNYRLANGEIDLIMRDNEYWVFVEVKYRADSSTEHPLGQIRQSQLLRIRRSAQVFLYSQGLSEYVTPCRFDVIAITGQPDQLMWVKDAF